MIEKIVPSNIDDRVISRAVTLLEDGALIALPTDTNWSVVCSIKSPAGIKKLRRLSGERDERHFTLLCSGISQFSEMCNLSNSRFRLINRLSPGPYVFILKTHRGTEKTLDIRRHEVGVRIPDYPVTIRLIDSIGCPLYAITAKKSMTVSGSPETFGDEQADTELPSIPEIQLFENAHELDDIKELSLILDSGEDRERIFSTILDMCQDEIKLLRQGAGPWPV